MATIDIDAKDVRVGDHIVAFEYGKVRPFWVDPVDFRVTRNCKHGCYK